jgi:protein involved in polysaccharide export with SLBB domain
MTKIIFYIVFLTLFFVLAVHGDQQSPYDTVQSQILNPQSAPQSGALAPSVPSVQLPQTVLPQMNQGTAVQAAPVLAPQAAALPPAPQSADYLANISSEVFGAQLFTGAFSRQSSAIFNPDYAIAIGDTIQTRLWGGFEFDRTMTVDPKGNIFIPIVGTVQVLGIRNKDLQQVVETSVRKVFKANVFCYASLSAAQPVRIFVGGFVRRPGLYNGTSMDSLLNYLDQAGGIDPDRGSFLSVQIKRNSRVRATVNLYGFMLEGNIPIVQLSDGDIIFVSSRQNTLKVNGLVQNAKRFEFSGAAISLAEIARYAQPKAETTHVRIVRSAGPIKNVEYYPLADAGKVMLANGDDVEFTADKKPGTITVRVEGEHQSAQEYVLPYGAQLKDVMKDIKFNERSEPGNIQLFRLSVKDRQKALLLTSLRSLENSVLNARSSSGEEAKLRTDEAALILKWVEGAKKIEPTGQVVISGTEWRNDMLLENGDIIRIPARDGLVLVSGEVLFPNAIAYDPSLSLDDYIKRAGGFTENATTRIIIAHVDGSFDNDSTIGKLKPGDQIMVLPKVDTKTRMFIKDIVQILFQIAVIAKTVALF